MLNYQRVVYDIGCNNSRCQSVPRKAMDKYDDMRLAGCSRSLEENSSDSMAGNFCIFADDYLPLHMW